MINKKTLLLNVTPPTLRGLFPDNGLSLLAACLNEKGIDSKILDYCNLDNLSLFLSNNSNQRLETLVQDLSRRIERDNITYVGSKLFQSGFSESIYVIQRIKELFGNKIVTIGGGPQVDYFWDLFDSEGLFYENKKGVFDALVINEGEVTLPSLVKSERKNWKKIPNLIYKENGRIIKTETKRIGNLDSLPFPSYNSNVYPAMAGNNKIKFINMRINWGCFYGNCKFCFHPIKSGEEFKEKSIGGAIKEIKHYIKECKTTAFRPGASAASSSINDFAKAVIELELNIHYSMFGNIRLLNEYDFKLLKDSGCISIFYGAESGNQKELDFYNKGITVKQTEEIVKATEDAGIHAMLSFIYLGNEKAGEDTLNLILRSQPSAISILPLAIMPYTPFAKNLPPNIYLGEDYFEKFMKQRVNLTRPKNEWWDLNCKINGKDASQLIHESEAIERAVEEHGILCRTTDETFVLAHYAKTPAKYIRDLEGEFKPNGDYEKIRRTVIRMNQNMGMIK